MGEPPVNGRLQLITTLFPLIVVVGAAGVSGSYAVRTDLDTE